MDKTTLPNASDNALSPVSPQNKETLPADTPRRFRKGKPASRTRRGKARHIAKGPQAASRHAPGVRARRGDG